MTPRAIAIAMAPALAIAASACAPALKSPPSSAAAIERSATAIEDSAAAIEGSAEVIAGAGSGGSAIEQARDAWARRPDVEAVRIAERSFLQAAEDDPSATEPLVGAARAKAWLTEHESDPALRKTIATSMVQTAQLCKARGAELPECDYWLAIALGLQAREKPTTAQAGLEEMVAALQRAERKDALLDEAGPARVLALVYLRAPGWPLGPGDDEAGLAAARRAVAARPGYPPNRLALGEALAKNGDDGAAREEYVRARDAARSAAASGNPDAEGWLSEAERALGR